MSHESQGPTRVRVPDEVRGAVGLSKTTQRSVRAIAEVLFATDEGPCSPEHLAWLLDDLDDFFTHAGARARASFGLCVTAISLVAPLFIRRLPPYRKLSMAERAEALERMEKSSMALPIFGAKAVLCIVYYEHPEAARKIGFDGTCLKDPV